MHVERVGKFKIRIRLSIPVAEWGVLEELERRTQTELEELMTLAIKLGVQQLGEAIERADAGETPGGHEFALWSLRRRGKVAGVPVGVG